MTQNTPQDAQEGPSEPRTPDSAPDEEPPTLPGPSAADSARRERWANDPMHLRQDRYVDAMQIQDLRARGSVIAVRAMEVADEETRTLREERDAAVEAVHLWRTACYRATSERDAALARAVAAEATVERVRALHVRYAATGKCVLCGEVWPCATIAALSQSTSPSEAAIDILRAALSEPAEPAAETSEGCHLSHHTLDGQRLGRRVTGDDAILWEQCPTPAPTGEADAGGAS